MSYYAAGSGDATIRDGVNIDDVQDVLDNMPDSNIVFEIYGNKNGTYIDILHEYANYYDEDIERALDEIAPFITEGYVSFSGEDDSHWKYEFNPDEGGYWEDKNGDVVYGLEEFNDEVLIAELKKRGYKCVRC